MVRIFTIIKILMTNQCNKLYLIKYKLNVLYGLYALTNYIPSNDMQL